jgi:hypothetical protein
MARTIKSWDKEVKQKYIEFSHNPDCKKCPLGFDSMYDELEAYDYRPYQDSIKKRYKVDYCACCQHILGIEPADPTAGYCPCHIYKHDTTKAFKMLLDWVEKEGL